jgi:hypothetical protein
MTYIITTNTHGDMDTFHEIDAIVGPVSGLVARYAGMNDHGLAVTSVWDSKADADRFFSEQLGPALQQLAGDEPATDVSNIVVSCDVLDVLIPERVG